jgi:hypothetical protein
MFTRDALREVLQRVIDRVDAQAIISDARCCELPCYHQQKN